MPSQRDMLFLKIARKNSLLSPEQAEKILTAIERRAEIGVEKDAGAIARELEFLRDVEVESIERVLRHSLPPERVGGFKIIDRVGRGSVGTVYRARQLSLDKIVALKLMHQKLSDQARFVEQFIHEAKAVARLNHPHIVHAFDAGEAEGHFYFAMEYIDGESLGEKLRRRGKLTESEVLGLARAVTQGLAHAHQNGLLHRDLKPDNILIGKDRQIKIGDLGLAIPLDNADLLAEEHKKLGTPFYISPEQAQGQGIDERSDLYSLGATLYHAISGKPPFTGKSVKEIFTKQVHQPPVPLSEAGAQVCPRMEALVLRLLEKDPGARFQSTGELLSAIDDAVRELKDAAAPRTRAPRSRPRGQARPGRPGADPRASRGAPEVDRHARWRKRSTIFTRIGAAVGSATGVIFLLIALSHGSDAEPDMDIAKRDLERRKAERSRQIVEHRIDQWEGEIGKREEEATAGLTRNNLNARGETERFDAHWDLLREFADTKASVQIIAEIDKIRDTLKAQTVNAAQGYFDRAKGLREEGKLYDALQVLENIPRKVRKDRMIDQQVEATADDIFEEIERTFKADIARVKDLRQKKEYQRALDILSHVSAYAGPDQKKEAAQFREDVQKEMEAFADAERKKQVDEETTRYRGFLREYQQLCMERQFKECISKALTLQAEMSTAEVRTLLETDLTGFQLLDQFVKDALAELDSMKGSGEELRIKMKDGVRHKGTIFKVEPDLVWITIETGGGKASIPLKLEKISDETIFAMVAERHSEKSPSYLIPLGVLFTYRGMLDVAQQHFDLAADRGFVPETWLERIKWLQENP